MPTQTSYNFSVLNDFPSQKVDLERLSREIGDSPIVIALGFCTLDGDQLSIVFKDVLAADDITSLHSVIAAHSGLPIEKPTVVKLQGESVPTQGFYQSTAFLMTANQSGVVTKDLSWPFDISLIGGSYQAFNGDEGDEFEVIAAPDTVIGALTQDAAEGADTLSVQDSVIENCAIGFFVTLADANQNITDCGRVLAIDKVNKTLKIETPLPTAASASSPTLVRISVKYLSHEVLADVGRVALGETLQGASHIPANRVIRFTYNNINGETQTPKKILVILEYYY